MKKGVGWLSIFVPIVLIATAAAQTPAPPAATTQFDGTYAFVSATTLDETYMTTWRTRMGRCGDIGRIEPLTIAAGQARYSGLSRVREPSGPQGELTMKLAAPASPSSLGVEIITRGTIDGNGTIRARQMGHSCSYDMVWQKQAR